MAAAIDRRGFLGSAALAGAAAAASALVPRAAAQQSGAGAAPAVTFRSVEHMAGSAVRYAYAAKAGPFLFLNGYEGFDFATGVPPAVGGPAGFPDYGVPPLRREADFLLQRMGQVLKEMGSDLAHAVRLDQYYTEADAVRAYHLARFAAFGKYVPPSTSIIEPRLFGARSNVSTSLVAVMPDPAWEVKGVYPENSGVSALSGYAPAVVSNDFVFAAGQMSDAKEIVDPDPPQGPHRRWGTPLPIRRQAESALDRLEGTLKAAGSSLANCVKAQAHVAGAENFADFVDVWNARFKASPPALAVVPAKGFASVEGIVEINLIALKDGAQRKKEVLNAAIPQMAAYAPAVRAGELVFAPGLLPLGRDGRVAGLDEGAAFDGLALTAQLQADALYDHAEAVAKAGGTSMKNAVRAQYWISDIAHFPGIALAWTGRYGTAPHPFACVVTPQLPVPGAVVMADFWFYAG